MNILLISTFVIFSAGCSALLLDGRNPSAYITVKEFRDLMDLIFEEKHYRHTLEHNVGAMLQDANNNQVSLAQLGRNYHTISQGYRQLLNDHAEMKKGLQNLRNLNGTVQTTLTNTSTGISELKRKSGTLYT